MSREREALGELCGYLPSAITLPGPAEPACVSCGEEAVTQEGAECSACAIAEAVEELERAEQRRADLAPLDPFTAQLRALYARAGIQ